MRVRVVFQQQGEHEGGAKRDRQADDIADQRTGLHNRHARDRRQPDRVHADVIGHHPGAAERAARQRAEQLRQQQIAHEKEQAERAHLQSFIDRFKASAAKAKQAQSRVKALLTKPLTADGAVQLALINNRGLQAEYNALGISEAAFVEASLPPNPVIGVERLSTGGSLDIERRVIANILALLTRDKTIAIADARFRQAQLNAALMVLPPSISAAAPGHRQQLRM